MQHVQGRGGLPLHTKMEATPLTRENVPALLFSPMVTERTAHHLEIQS